MEKRFIMVYPHLPFHPLESLIQKFFSLDHQLTPETIKQIHLLEIVALLFLTGLVLLMIFSKCWRQISIQKLRNVIIFLTLLIAILLRIVSAERGFETMDFFDSVHYTVSAQEFLNTGNFTLPINEKNYPSSKAPGFSLTIAPFYLFFKDQLGAAVYAPLILGLFSLLLLYFLAKHLTDSLTALLSLSLLAFSPLHITYSKLIMPSMVPLFFILAGFFLIARYPKNLLLIGLAGIFFGFAGITRYLAVAAIPAAIIYLMASTNFTPKERFQKISALLIGAALPLGWLFYFQWQEFGSPFQTGYGYWGHFSEIIQKPFSPSYAFGIPPTSGGSPNAIFNLISATGAYIPFPNIIGSRPDQIIFSIFIWLFTIRGLIHFFQINRPLFFFIVTFFLCHYLPHAFLHTQTGHFMLPVAPFIILSASKGMSLVFKKISPRFRSFSYGMALIGLISFLPFAYTFSHEPFDESIMREFLGFLKEKLPENVYLISDFEPVLLTHQVGRKKNVTLIGVSKKVDYTNRKFYLKGNVLPPIIKTALENKEWISQLILKKEPMYLAPYDENKFRSDYDQFSSEFKSVKIAQSKHFKLYQLIPSR